MPISKTSIGPLIEEAALIAAVEAGAIAGAGLDDFEEEPLPTASRLRAFDNALSSHVAGLSDAAAAAMTARCVDNILSYLDGRALEPGLVLNPELSCGRHGLISPEAGADGPAAKTTMHPT